MSGIPVEIIKIGNSHGIRIPKALLEHINLPAKVELEVVGDQLVLRPEGASLFPALARSVASVGVKAVVMGGGTGSFMVLSHLRHYVANISAVVNMSDDGGSTGVLRDELGVLPPGDVRQCLVALSNTPEYMRELFNYRFESGSLRGHAFGNLFLTALEKISGDFGEAVRLAERMLNVGGRVIPVTTQEAILEAQFLPETVKGQSNFAEHGILRKSRPVINLSPTVCVNPEAVEAINEADMVVIGPGDLYSSVIPALLPLGLKEALQNTNAKKIFVCNLVNKPNTTAGMRVHDYIEVIESYIGKGVLNYAVYNTGYPAESLRQRYLQDGEEIVRCDEESRSDAALIGRDLLGQSAERQKADPMLGRSLIRHDGNALARLLMQIYFS